jgi:hypothetical protein
VLCAQGDSTCASVPIYEVPVNNGKPLKACSGIIELQHMPLLQLLAMCSETGNSDVVLSACMLAGAF